MPGPTPTPTNIRLLRGNPSKRPINNNEPQPPIEPACPDVPPFLTGYAADEWLVTGPHLHRIGLLTSIDVSAFAAYCDAYGRWRLAQEALQRMADLDPVTHGMLIKSQVGDPRRTPLVRAVEAAGHEMLAWASEFGLTPVARARLGAAGFGGQPGGPSKFDGLLNPSRPR